MQSRSLNIRVPRLGINRFGVFYVRSSETDDSGRRKVTQRSLGTKDPVLAKILALGFCLSLVSEDLMSDLRKNNQTYELDLEKGIAKANGPKDHERMMEALNGLRSTGAGGHIESMLRKHLPADTSTPQSPARAAALPEAVAIAQGMAAMPKPLDAGIKLRVAMDRHLDEEGRTRKSGRTLQEKRALFKEFCAFFGDVYLNQITLSEITERWRVAEFKRPNEKAKDKVLSLARLEKRRGYLSKFFDWATGSGGYMHDNNPMGQKMASKKEIRATTQPYKEFTGEDLKALFGSRYITEMQKPDWHWVPLMSLYSGARLSEIADLTTDAFETIDGIDAFFIPDTKTPDGRRTVPVHSVLMELGLLKYVDFLRAQGETHLFGLRPADSRGKSVGRQWGLWVSRCGIKDAAKTFHSFRSTAITDMHNGDAPNVAAIRESVGHSVGTGGAHGGYIRGARLRRIRDTVESLRYPTIELADLKLEDPTFSVFFLAEKERLASPQHAAQVARRKSNEAARADREARVARQRKRLK